jgi:penicillin-binding protein 2
VVALFLSAFYLVFLLALVSPGVLVMQRPNPNPANPLLLLAAAISLILGAFVGRLYQLQVANYQEFAQRSRNNQVRLETVRALRGEVFARDGKTPIIQNRQVVDLILKGGARGIEASAPPPAFWDQIRVNAGLPARLPAVKPGKEVTLARNLPPDNQLALSEWLVGQRQFELRSNVERVYPSHAFGGLLGYTAGASEADELKGYAIDDLKGVAGLEGGMEALLRGQNGIKAVEVDAQGTVVAEQQQVEAQAGKRITLTIDLALQRKVQGFLNDSLANVNRLRASRGKRRFSKPRGAVVVVKPQTGEVLGLASAPEWDPSIFNDDKRNAERAALLFDEENHSLNSRATGLYEPGSTFKLVTASMVLENGWGNRYFSCVPAFRFGGRFFKNWARSNMGMLNAGGAIAQSCNTWYYQYAAYKGPILFANELVKRANEFGFNEKSGIELPGEKIGEVYTDPRGEIELGEGLNNSIGQGKIQATPLQIARMLSTIVNDGKRPELTLIKAIDGQAVPIKPMKQLTGSNWEVLKGGMRKTVVSGTAKQVLGGGRFPIATAGKTGTAQHGPAKGDHAWYMGYGPYENPEIVVVAFLEEGIEGSGAALPLVAKVMSAYWKVPLK